MKKALLLLLLSFVIILSSCVLENNNDKNDSTPPPEEIYVPPLSENAKEAVSLSNIVYVRPNPEELMHKTELLTKEIGEKSVEYNRIIESILSIDKEYSSFSTMLTYAMLKNSADSADSFYAAEYEYLRTASPSLTRAIEDLFVAAANSEFAEKLEEDIFWNGFVEDYADGTIYNDELVAILENEAELESNYFSLSTSTVLITYGGKTDTYDNILTALKEKYAEGSVELAKATEKCEKLYDEALKKESTNIYIELVKVRRTLADTLGYDSYAQYAYDILGHGYTEAEMSGLITDISKYAIPVYSALSAKAFGGYFKTHKSPALDKGRCINNIYKALNKADPFISEVYAYMLNCGLYDVESKKQNRLPGAFTTYLYDLRSPYLFATTDGDVGDYLTLTHEFGHFYDYYVNDTSVASLDLMEVSSTGLELLLLSYIGDSITEGEYKYLYYSEMRAILEMLIFQAYYAKLESMIYALPYGEITKEKLDILTVEAAEYMHLNPEYFNSIDSILIYHLIMEPFYVQSYCTSTISSLDIFFIECDEPGAGVNAYITLIDRQGGDDFITELGRADLPSPMRKNAVKELVDEIYYSIIGSYYFVNNSDQNNAA